MLAVHKIWSKIIVLLMLGVFCASTIEAAVEIDAVVRSVVAMSGTDDSGERIFASAFLVETGRRNTVWLVSTAHSFNNVAADHIRIDLRHCNRGIYSALPLQVRIRERGRPLYFTHSHFDLAAIKIEMPADADCCIFSRDFIADETNLSRLPVGAGTQVLIPGYPYGEACNEAGFAYTRSGVISSFPVRPASMYPIYHVDFEVFAGYSGAPVIFSGSTGVIMLGMVLEEVFLEELRPQKGKKQLRTRRGLGLARVLSAPSIRDFISGLR
ncbi:MAG: hypothetical protein KKB51_07165 [Candidatus Riflebacteria bacterium]|nr:hypothetical protein [Candidatus Riflebacteria bacterium]